MISPYSMGDLIETAIFFLIVLAGCIALLVKRPETPKDSYKYVRRPLVTAAGILVVGAVAVCLIGGRWDLNYIISYLTLHRITHANAFRGLAFAAYALICFGVATLVLIKLNGKRKPTG